MKCFLAPSGVEDFGHVSETDLVEAMPRLARSGAPLLVHAEDPAVIDAARAASGLDAEPHRYRNYLASRPAQAEVRAVEMMIRLCRETGCRVHVVHVATPAVLGAIGQAVNDGLPIGCETCPHYLTLAAERIEDGATAFKCAPPIRTEADRAALWDGLRGGRIGLVASDHSPCPPGLKCLDAGDFSRAWGGIASMELGLSAVWTEASRMGRGLADLGGWMSEGPARLAGLHGRKGRIAVGYDADLIVFGPEDAFTVEPAALRQRHKITPYAGMTLRGIVRQTFVRGRLVFDNGRLTFDRPGQWMKRRTNS